MFWLAFGTAAAVIGLALMTIGVTRSAPANNLLASLWFDGGLGLLAIGVLLLLWALWLFAFRRRSAQDPTAPGHEKSSPDVTSEAVRAYYREREKLFDIYDREKSGRPNGPSPKP